MDETRYRLRNGSRIVGYMRKMGSSALFYSKDAFWWTGRELQYEQIDEWCGFRDKNRRFIFEWDILRFKIDPDGPTEEGVVLWEANRGRFVIRHLQKELYFPFVLDDLELFRPKDLEVFSYLFINPDLQESLGIFD